MTEHADALEALLASAGWIVFRDHIRDEWGPVAYARRLKAAVSRARAEGTDIALAVTLVDEGNNAIADAMRWPADELARLRRAETQPAVTLSRRGNL